MKDVKYAQELIEQAKNLLKEAYDIMSIKGSITVRYMDESGNDILEPTVLNNLELGSYEIESKIIDDYEIIED